MGDRRAPRRAVRLLAACAALALVALAAPASAQAPTVGQELLVNGGFETGDLTGWTVRDHPEPYEPLAVVGAGDASPFGLFTSEPVGTSAVLHAFDGGGPGTIEISQPVAIPPGLGARFTVELRAGWDLDRWCAGCDEDRTVEVQVRTPGGEVLDRTEVLRASPGTTRLDTGGIGVDVDLSAHRGQDVVVAVVARVPGDFTGPARLQIDEASVITEALPPSSTTPSSSTTSSTTAVGAPDGAGAAPTGPAAPAIAVPATPRYAG